MPSYKALYNREPSMKQQGNALNQQQPRTQAPQTPTSRSGMQRAGASPQALARAQQLTVPKSQMYRQAAAQTRGQSPGQSQGPTLAPGAPGGSVYDPTQGMQQKALEQAYQQRSESYYPGGNSGFDPDSPGEAPVPVSAQTPRSTRDIAEDQNREWLEAKARSTEEEEALARELGDYYLGEKRRDAASRGGAFGLGGSNIAMDNDLREQTRLNTLREQVGWRQNAREEELAKNLAGMSGFGSMRGQDFQESKWADMQKYLDEILKGGRGGEDEGWGVGGVSGYQPDQEVNPFAGTFDTAPEGATYSRGHGTHYDIYEYNGAEILVRKQGVTTVEEEGQVLERDE